MSEIFSVLRALVRDELARRREPALGTVTRVHARAADDGANHQADVRLRDSGLELPRVPIAVGRLGLSALPNEGDLVLIAFIGGDLNAPVLLGCLYDDQAHPPEASAHELVYQPPDEENDDARRLHLALPGGGTITVKDGSVNIVLGGTTVTVEKDGDVAIVARGKLDLRADSDVSITAAGDLKLEAQGQLSLSGLSATVEGQGQTKVKGAQIAIAGITQFSPS